MPAFFKQHCRRCGENYPPERMVSRCSNCDVPISFSYDYALVKESLGKDGLNSRKPNLWKYRELLPVVDSKNVVSLDETMTPLVRSKRIGPASGLEGLFFKDDTRLPTGSLKDRCGAVSISKANESGVDSVIVCSSGNGASSAAAYSARAGISCYVIAPSYAARNKLVQCMTYGAKVIRVKGIIGKSVEIANRISRQRGWPDVSTAAAFNPYSLQGQKTSAFEIFEQLEWEVPDWVVLPVGSGNCLAGQWAGFVDLFNLGFTRRKPKMAAVQSSGCAPFVDAIRKGLGVSEVKAWENPSTIAGGVSDEYPYDLEYALPAIRESGGAAVSVSDEEILKTVRDLGEEAMFVEPTGAVATAGVRQLVEEGLVGKRESVVSLLSGSGLKDPTPVGEFFGESEEVEPDFESVNRVLDNWS